MIKSCFGRLVSLPRYGLLLCLFCVFFLSACSGSNNLNASTALSSTTAHAAERPLGVQPCPDAVKQPAHWNSIVGIQSSGTTVVESVSCGHMVGNTSLQALVTVRSRNAEASLDVFVYTNLADRYPTQLFSLRNLSKGSARISQYSTILTGEVDKNSSLNKGKPITSTRADLFREFWWFANGSRFAQAAFPGIFPDMTRFQAELDQERVNKGQDTWKLDAVKTATTMVKQFLAWKRPITANIISGGGSQDVNASVRVEEAPPVGSTQNPAVVVMLSRLAGKVGNIWEVIEIRSNGKLTVTSPAQRIELTSPVRVTGGGPAFEGVVGRAFVLNHLYNEIGEGQALGDGNGSIPFTADVHYTSTVPAGIHEEGVIALYSYSMIDGGVVTAVMKKVLI
jgi:hypothetical protein